VVTDRIDPEALPPAPPAEDEEEAPDGAEGAPAEPVPAAVGRWGVTWSGSQGVERVLTVGMFACISWTVSQALLSGGMRPSQALALFLLATAFFAAGVAVGGRAGGRNYRRYADYGITDWVLLLIPLLVLVRLLPSILEGPGAVGRDIGRWMDDPITFWDASLAWGIIILFFVWDGALSVAHSLGTLAFQTAEPASASRRGRPTALEWDNTPYRFADHNGAWRHLMRLFIFGGFLTLLFTGLALVDVDQLGNPQRPEVGGVMPAVLLYYLLGLILASQTSLDRLRAGWLRGGVAIQPGLARRWLGYSLALMGLGLLLALMLPTSFSDQAADQLPLIWRWLWFIRLPLTFIFRLTELLIGGLAALLFAPFALLFPRADSLNAPAIPTPAPVPTPLPVQPDSGLPPSIGGRLLWGLLLYVLPTALLLYAAWNTWRKRKVIWRDLRAFTRAFWQLLREAVLDLTAAFWRIFSFGSPRLLSLAPRAIQERLRRRRARRLGSSDEPSGWLRLRNLGPRELILYFYVSLLQRAEGVGWKREKGQTPYEYGRDLAQHLPDRKGEVDALTEAFVRARYSPSPVSPDEAQRARGPWQRLRDSMQTRRRAGQLASWLFGRG
jgi:hypothetical protein